MDIDITLLEIDWDFTADCAKYIQVLRIKKWCLLYIEKNPKHAGGGIKFLYLFGFRLI